MMKTIYLLDKKSKRKHVLTVRKANDFKLPRDFDGFDATIDEILISNRAPVIDLNLIEHRGNILHFKSENWIWVDNKKVLAAILTACRQFDVFDFFIYGGIDNCILMHYGRNNRGYWYYFDPEHLEPIGHSSRDRSKDYYHDPFDHPLI